MTPSFVESRNDPLTPRRSVDEWEMTHHVPTKKYDTGTRRGERTEGWSGAQNVSPGDEGGYNGSQRLTFRLFGVFCFLFDKQSGGPGKRTCVTDSYGG